MNKKNFVFAVLAVLLALTFLPMPASATYTFVPNGSYETGDLTDWANSFTGAGSFGVIVSPLDANIYATHGSFLSRGTFQCFNSSANTDFDTNTLTLVNGKTYDINFDFGISKDFDASLANFCLFVTIGAQTTSTCSDTDTNYKKRVWYGNQGTKPMQAYSFSVTNSTGTNQLLRFRVLRGSSCGALLGYHLYVGIDNVRVNEYKNLINTITTDALPRNVLESGYIYVTVKGSDGITLTGADANVSVNFNSAGYQSATWDATLQKYKYLVAGLGQGSYSYSVQSSKSGEYISDTDAGTWTVQVNPIGIICTGIQNASCYPTNTQMNIVSADNGGNIIFSVYNPNDFTVSSVKYSWDSALRESKQFFVYSSSDGSTWTFDDSLTFGDSSNYNDPVQKIWLNNHYKYSFRDSLNPQETKYFKLVYLAIPAYWTTTKDSLDWVNINEPSSYIDENFTQWDLFNDSNYTHVQSYTRKNYPQLTSSDFNAGFEVQFTAFASEATTLQVGYRTGNGNDTVASVPLTTALTRFSVPVALADWNSFLLIKSSASANARIYLSDYAIVPRSYFTSRLEVFNLDGSPLDSILSGSASYEYVKEGVPFRFRTGAFDKDLDLKTLRVEAKIGTVTIKTFEFDLTQSTPLNKIYSWDQIVEGVIDLNGTASILAVMQPFRDFTLKATLINTFDQNVAEQFKTVKLLQYPFFATDFAQNISTTNKKLGTNPKLNYSIIQTNPAMFIGIDVLIYDSNHSVTNPNFQKTIYADELGCSTLASCQKTLTFNEYVWEQATNYTVRFTALLKTEAKSYTNYLTTTTQSVFVTEGQLETARIFQVFERRDTDDSNKAKYRNDEEIPLVLQIRDDTCKNLKNDLAPYIKLTTYDGVTDSPQTTRFFPQKFIYDEKTCYNYWLWNNLFYMDDGSLLPDGNTVRFVAYMATPTGSHSTTGYVLVNKCSGYPSDFFKGNFLMNWLGFVGDLTYGCTDITDPVQPYTTSTEEVFLTIDNSYSPSALQNESVFCVRSDVNFAYKATLGDEFVCGVLFLKSEQQIDGFKVIIGNAFSDYAKTASTEKQYIDFEIPAEDVIFNDVILLRSALATEFNTNRINTLGQLLSAGVNKLLPYGQGFVDFTQDTLNSGIWIQNAGADINLSEQLNPNKVSGLYFFKVSGLQVINQYDFIADYPELETINPSMFRSYMNAQGVYLPKKQATVQIYSNSFENFNAFKVDSPLIIFEKPSTYRNTRQLDANNVQRVVPSLLKFNFIVDMYSNNQQTVQRAFVPIVFSYFVPNTVSFGSIMKGINDLITDPVGTMGAFLGENWFALIMLLILAIVGSLIYANVKGGGKININFGRQRE